MKRYNLIDEAWIPVRFRDGNRGELGILETLRRSPDIAALEDPSPLVTAALHRLLLAVLYRALRGPCDIDEARALFKGGLPMAQIETYLATWRERFWLFDKTHPFGQIPGFEPKVWRAWTVLAAEHNADNAKVLFDHIDVQAPGTILEGPAARWLMASQTFSVSCGKSELSHTGTAPSATAAILIPLGVSLEDTLILSLIPQSRHLVENDQPIWERDPETLEALRQGAPRECCGLADRYTWRTRSVLLHLGSEGVEKLAFASGVQFASKGEMDPMQAYREIKDKGLLPLAFQERGLWREFDTLLPDKENLSPRNIQHAAELTKKSPARFPGTVLAIGQSNNKAKIEYWRMERFALPQSLISDRFVRGDISSFLEQAESSQSALWSACSTYGRMLIGRGDRTPHKKDVRNFVAQMPCIPAYWSTLEAAFHSLLQSCTACADPEAIRRGWLKTVRDALSSAWNLHSQAARSGDAWAIRALVRAEGAIGAELKKLDGIIQELDASLAKEEA